MSLGSVDRERKDKVAEIAESHTPAGSFPSTPRCNELVGLESPTERHEGTSAVPDLRATSTRTTQPSGPITICCRVVVCNGEDAFYSAVTLSAERAKIA
jgi:hypothetical protein